MWGKKVIRIIKQVNTQQPSKNLTFLSFLHSANLLRKLNKGGAGGGGVQIKRSPSKKAKAIPQLHTVVGSNRKVPKSNISYQRKKETGAILKKILFDKISDAIPLWP